MKNPIRPTDDMVLDVQGTTHRLIRGDCVLALRKLPDACLDVVMTSPPYNIGLDYGKSYDDSMKRDQYLAWLEEIFIEIVRVLKPKGSFFLNVGGTLKDPNVPYQVLGVAQRHFVLQNNIIWVKSITVGESSTGHFKPVSSPRFLNNCFEHVFHLTKEGDALLDRLAIGVKFADQSNATRWKHGRDKRCRGNTWFVPYDTITSKKQKKKHPAIFPRALVENCLKLHGGFGTVLDPFSGIGTTSIAAAELGWNSIGIEIDRSWHLAAFQSLSALA